jgi:predicted ester cyclase
MKTVRLVVVMLVCIAIGVAAGYRLALTKQHNRLERNKALARIAEEEVYSGRNSEAAIKVAREIFANDYVSHDWTGDSTGGLAGFEMGIAANRADYPDWTEKVESMVAEGDLVAVRILSSGTQARDLAAVPHIMPAIPNKHRFVRFPEMEIFKVSNGKLAEQWDISDGWDANAQAGLFDPDHWPESVCGTAQKR